MAKNWTTKMLSPFLFQVCVHQNFHEYGCNILFFHESGKQTIQFRQTHDQLINELYSLSQTVVCICWLNLFIWTTPNFQFVLSMLSLNGGCSGSSLNINRLIRLKSISKSAKKRCILRILEAIFAVESRHTASFWKFTVWVWHKAQINKPKNFILAKCQLNSLLRKTNKSLYLHS